MHTTPDPLADLQRLATPKTTEEIREEQAKPRAVGDMKHGLGGARPAMSILPRTGLVHGGRAIEYGADKYARGNYHGAPPAKLGEHAEAKRLLGYIDAAMRHLTHVSDKINRALGTGGDVNAAASVVDDEASGGFPASNLPHLDHALASLLIGVSCAVDGGLLPVDPGQPWKAAMPETGLPQKDNPAAERERVAALQKQRLDDLNNKRYTPGPRHAYNPLTHRANPDGTIVPIHYDDPKTPTELEKLDAEIEAGFAGEGNPL